MGRSLKSMSQLQLYKKKRIEALKVLMFPMALQELVDARILIW